MISIVRGNAGIFIVGALLSIGAVAAITPSAGFGVSVIILAVATVVGLTATWLALLAHTAQVDRILERFVSYPESSSVRAEARAALAELPSDELVRLTVRRGVSERGLDRVLDNPDRDSDVVLDYVLDALRERRA